MYLEINQISFNIKPSTLVKGISIGDNNGGIIDVLVNPHIGQAELYSYLQNLSAKAVMPKAIAVQTAQTEQAARQLPLFDKMYSCVVNPLAQEAYLSKGVLMLAKIPKSKAGIEKIQHRILKQEIMPIIGFWEEKLEVFVSAVNFRKLKSSHFSVDISKKEITFHSLLHRKSITFIAYVTAIACFKLTGIREEEQEAYLAKYVPDWKRNERIFKYEEDERNKITDTGR